jgi:type II secretory pathway component PulM
MAAASRRNAVAPAPSGGLRAALEAQVESMSPRDRKLLAGLFVFFAVVICGGAIWYARGVLDAKAKTVRNTKDNVVLFQAMAEQYEQDSEKIAKAEQSLSQYKGQPASAYLEKAAQTAGVRDAFTVTQQGSEVVGSLRQTTYRVELRNVPLESVVGYIHDIETSGYPLSVDLARLKASGGPEGKVISLTLELVSYQLAEGQ